MKKRLLLLPCLSNRHRLPVDPPIIILKTSLKKQLIKFLKGGSFWNGHHIVTTTEPNPVFDLSFLPASTRRAEVGLKQIVGSKGHKGAVFCSLSSFSLVHCQFHGSCQVIIADPSRNPAKMLECLHMTIEEAFLSLGRKTHHKRSTRIAQPQNEDLYGLPHATDGCNCFSPVTLRVLTWIIFQWEKQIRRLVFAFPLRHIQLYP